MAETTWCQNPKCPQKRMKYQIRGNKGNKWYQSNKAQGYGADILYIALPRTMVSRVHGSCIACIR